MIDPACTVHIKERLTAKHDRPSMYTTPEYRTVQQYIVHITQVQSKGWHPKS